MVKSVSWPTPTTTGMGRGADRPRQRLLVELPQVLDRAAAAHQEQHVALGAPAGAREHRHDALGGALALHGDRVDDHRDRRVAARQRGQDVAQRGRGERGQHADRARVRRQLALGGFVEQALALELLLEPQEALVERPDAGAAQAFDGELEAAARLVQGDQRARLDLHAVAQLPVERRGAAAEHHAVDLRAAVLEREIPVPRRGARQVGQLAAHPEQGEAPLERVADAAQELGNAEDGAFQGTVPRVSPSRSEPTLIHTVGAAAAGRRLDRARRPILTAKSLFVREKKLLKI